MPTYLSSQITFTFNKKTVKKLQRIFEVDGNAQFEIVGWENGAIIIAAVDKKTGDVIDVKKLSTGIVFGDVHKLTRFIPNSPF